MRLVCYLANPCSLGSEVDDADEASKADTPEGHSVALVGRQIIERAEEVLSHHEDDDQNACDDHHVDGEIDADHAHLNAMLATSDLLARNELAVTVHVAHVRFEGGAAEDFDTAQRDDEHHACDEELQPLDGTSGGLRAAVSGRCL